MTLEHADNEAEVSDEQWENLMRDAQHYFDLGMAKRAGDTSESCQHLLGNLCAPLKLVLGIKVPPEKRAAHRARMMKGIEAIKKYLALLEEFPDFAAKELSSGTGFFPDALTIRGSHEDVVDVYEERLKDASSKISQEGVE